VSMFRREAMAALKATRGDAITVVTEQAIGAWRDALGKAANEIEDNVDIVGSMGSASSIGLGIALAQPARRVIVMDGDGSLLMQLGSLVTIAGAAPPNLVHVVFENGVYETSGNQPLPGEGRFDLTGMAVAAGYASAYSFSDSEIFARALPDLLTQHGPVFISLRITPEDGFLRRNAASTRIDAQMHALHDRLTRRPGTA
jgi:thiamine pyrophosphate-dependent acetolactate synthase large subunit-like protein